MLSYSCLLHFVLRYGSAIQTVCVDEIHIDILTVDKCFIKIDP